MSDQRILLWSQDAELKIWDLKKIDKSEEVLLLGGNYKGPVFLLRDLRILFLHEGSLKIWDIKASKIIKTLGSKIKDPVYRVLHLNDGRILTFSGKSSLEIWDINSEKQGPQRVLQHENFINGVRLLRDGNILSWTTEDLYFWNINEHAKLLNLLNGLSFKQAAFVVKVSLGKKIGKKINISKNTDAKKVYQSLPEIIKSCLSEFIKQ